MDSVVSASFSNCCLTKMALRGTVKANTLQKSSGQPSCVPALRNPGYSLSLGTEMPWPLTLCKRESNAGPGLPCYLNKKPQGNTKRCCEDCSVFFWNTVRS